ncbi:MAG: DegT/DnrJ/EryC1/StrS family aminotransferase [Anaerolineae bacterium]|nr:DegT/DnrJ/EryC1/StrS family aminotransferase [Anaerolineae bacterium]
MTVPSKFEPSRAIPVFQPFHGQEEIDAVAEVLRSGWWGQGPKTAEFERRFAEFVDSPLAVSVNSATAALHLAMAVAGVEGGEVISTSMTFVSTNTAILYNNAIPVFADIKPDTLNIDPDDVERKITHRTRAIVAVDYGGHPADLDRLLAIAEAHNLAVIEDAAHAAGALYKGRNVGSIAPLTCFSFHPVKNLATGDGGMVTLRDEEWAARLRRLRWVGINQDTWLRSAGKAANQYSWQYDVTELGYKYHTNDIMSAIALVQLERLPQTNARRREIAVMYDEGLADLDWLQLPVRYDHVVSSQHNYVVRLDNRDRLADWLRSHKVATGMHYVPNHFYNVFEPYAASLPVTEREWERLLTLPLFPALTDDEVGYIIETIRNYDA